ncbi:MAG: hypothetical protein RIS35_1085 [Pseudomonadota bacterium]
MHHSALVNCRYFFDTYGNFFRDLPAAPRIVDIGSQDVNGSLRGLAPEFFEYTGLDFVEGRGVDLVLEDPYHLPFDDGSVDVVLSSSCFEHSEMFWLTFLEAIRILKPSGLFYLNAPSNGSFHRYPVDCWRFYPDSGEALAKWARHNGSNTILLESFISHQTNEFWNDFVGIFLKDASCADRFPNRIVSSRNDFTNGRKFGSTRLINPSELTEDQKRLASFGRTAMASRDQKRPKA